MSDEFTGEDYLEIYNQLNDAQMVSDAYKVIDELRNAVFENNVEVIRNSIVWVILKDMIERKNSSENKQIMKTLEVGTKLYRARVIQGDCRKYGVEIKEQTDEKTIGYDSNNSREPILGISPSARNNINGSSYLYVGSDPETACVEIKSPMESTLSLAEFEITHELKIVDFVKTKRWERELSNKYNLSIGTLIRELMGEYVEPYRDNDSYRLTQLVSDEIRKMGVDGICYKSFYTKEGINYTIFNCNTSWIKFIASKLVYHRYEQHAFIDFNEKNMIESCSVVPKEYSEYHVKFILERLRKYIEQYKEDK